MWKRAQEHNIGQSLILKPPIYHLLVAWLLAGQRVVKVPRDACLPARVRGGRACRLDLVRLLHLHVHPLLEGHLRGLRSHPCAGRAARTTLSSMSFSSSESGGARGPTLLPGAPPPLGALPSLPTSLFQDAQAPRRCPGPEGPLSKRMAVVAGCDRSRFSCVSAGCPWQPRRA